MADMEVDPPAEAKGKGKKDNGKKRFEVKKVGIDMDSRESGASATNRVFATVERRFALGMGSVIAVGGRDCC